MIFLENFLQLRQCVGTQANTLTFLARNLAVLRTIRIKLQVPDTLVVGNDVIGAFNLAMICADLERTAS